MINFRLFSCVLVNLWSNFVAKIWCQEGGNEKWDSLEDLEGWQEAINNVWKVNEGENTLFKDGGSCRITLSRKKILYGLNLLTNYWATEVLIGGFYIFKFTLQAGKSEDLFDFFSCCCRLCCWLISIVITLWDNLTFYQPAVRIYPTDMRVVEPFHLALSLFNNSSCPADLLNFNDTSQHLISH